MPGVLGVACTSSATYLANCLDGVVLEVPPYRLIPPIGIEAGADLWAFMDSVTDALAKIRPDLVVLLLPEEQGPGGRKGRPPGAGPTHRSLTPRIAMETVVKMAVAKERIPCDVLARATVRSRLGLPLKGNLDLSVDRGDPPRGGPYWGDGRGLAALAARAGEIE